MKFYAHSTSKDDKSDWQGLAEHLLGTAVGAADRARVFGADELARVSGLLHDLGKYTLPFQQRLSGDPQRVDHATWGAHIARQRYGGLGELLAYGIAGHHAGLANGRLGQEDQSRPTLMERLSDDYRQRQLPALLDVWQQEVMLPERLELPIGFSAHPDKARRSFQLSLLTRMIFSCLVDADFVDTDNFYRRMEGRPPREQEGSVRPTLDQLLNRLNAHLETLPATGGINPLRNHILREIRSKARQPCGLFSMTVPTGGGKTLASLAFALDHAVAHARTHGIRRVIYVIPFTSIIEQTAQVFRQALGDFGRENVVLEHHSAFHDDPARSPESIAKRNLAMENWDAPIVVTTAVQFLESLFADRPSRCRKLHSIAGSVVVLDEAQTLPVDLLRPCVALLDELTRNYRVSAVLCTATQPALSRAQGFDDGLEDVTELAPDPRVLYTELKRVRVRHAGVLDDAAIVSRLSERDQVLCIVNNRRHARHLFEAIRHYPGAFHLTTLMHSRHRSQVLAQVRGELKAGRPCRLVSTSLIEAGVDVSFPAVLRAEAGLDSIAQAAGRCNRNKEWDVAACEVVVFEVADKDWAPPPELKLYVEVFREIERFHRDDLLSLDAVDTYFKTLYWRLGKGRLDRRDLMGLLRGSEIGSLPLDSMARRFKVIQTTMRPIIVPFLPASDEEVADVAAVFRQLEFAERAGTAEAARKLQSWLIQIPEAIYQVLWKAHAIMPVAPERYGEQFVKLTNPYLYDAGFGLQWDRPEFRDAHANVW